MCCIAIYKGIMHFYIRNFYIRNIFNFITIFILELVLDLKQYDVRSIQFTKIITYQGLFVIVVRS